MKRYSVEVEKTTLEFYTVNAESVDEAKENGFKYCPYCGENLRRLRREGEQT